jgi:hypothetical protein
VNPATVVACNQRCVPEENLISNLHKALTLITISSLLFPFNGQAGEIHTEFPQHIDSQAHYLFYSHGQIVEGGNPKPRHPQWGIYDFPAVKRKLAAADIELIAYHRPEKTNLYTYAKTLAAQVDELLAAGVSANRITLLGFSKGGQISAMADWYVKNSDINLIIMAGCGEWIKKADAVQLYGHFLSIYEASDAVGSCQSLADRSPELASFEELEINTGKEHGAFYKPREEWLQPVFDWIEKR